jgi:hypothetical protein
MVDSMEDTLDTQAMVILQWVMDQASGDFTEDTPVMDIDLVSTEMASTEMASTEDR